MSVRSKILDQRWQPGDCEGLEKEGAHQAWKTFAYYIEELRYYALFNGRAGAISAFASMWPAISFSASMS